mmetsp:Transcript_18087/g.68580  ORF Transcript_18087/g.68580 Transcript_18087/m.68580 type:complete len:260 (-) Transcript_18087:1350-2129(-)
MYSNMNDIAFRTPFCTFRSGMRYSFISAGRTVNGPHVSATMAMATVVQTRIWRSCTFRLLSRVCRTSCGPMALAMYPNVFTAARRIAFLCALSISSSSKHIRIHSRALTCSAPRSAIRPTRSMQFSCTFSWRFLRIGVSRGSSSRIGGVIWFIPTTFTMLFRAPKIEPSTSGYSSPRYSKRIWPRYRSHFSSPHRLTHEAILAMRSAACMRTADEALFKRHLMVPQICGRYGCARVPKAFTTVPKPLSMTDVSSLVCSW